MATNTLIIWIGIYCLLFYFFCKSKDEQLRILGWIGWIVNACVGGVVLDSPITLFFSLITILIGVYRIYQIGTGNEEVSVKNAFE